jgi:hypothetical protein
MGRARATSNSDYFVSRKVEPYAASGKGSALFRLHSRRFDVIDKALVEPELLRE